MFITVSNKRNRFSPREKQHTKNQPTIQGRIHGPVDILQQSNTAKQTINFLEWNETNRHVECSEYARWSNASNGLLVHGRVMFYLRGGAVKEGW